MADEKPKPTQKTQPKKGKPIEIRVPAKREIDAAIKKISKAPRKSSTT